MALEQTTFGSPSTVLDGLDRLRDVTGHFGVLTTMAIEWSDAALADDPWSCSGRGVAGLLAAQCCCRARHPPFDPRGTTRTTSGSPVDQPPPRSNCTVAAVVVTRRVSIMTVISSSGDSRVTANGAHRTRRAVRPPGHPRLRRRIPGLPTSPPTEIARRGLRVLVGSPPVSLRIPARERRRDVHLRRGAVPSPTASGWPTTCHPRRYATASRAREVATGRAVRRDRCSTSAATSTERGSARNTS